MMHTKNFIISTEYLNLQAELFKSKSDKNDGFLLFHPHPDYGGDMYNNVVDHLFKQLIKEDLTCLRFNFSGIGKSFSEKKTREYDVITCFDYLIEEESIDRIILCGYSYGAALGCSKVGYSDNILGFIAISFPFDFMGKIYLKNSQTDKPKLFIQGDNDKIALYTNFKKYYKLYDDPKEYVIIEGADHFYRGYENQIVQHVLEFYNKNLKK